MHGGDGGEDHRCTGDGDDVGTDTRTGIGAAVGGDSDNVVVACVDASGDAGSGGG